MNETNLGITRTIEVDEKNIIIGLDRKFQTRLNNGKPIEFHAKINENGKLVLESSCLEKLSKTGCDRHVEH